MGVDKRYSNLPEEEIKKGAQTGNNPGASAVADDTRVPLDSVNAEPKVQDTTATSETQHQAQAPASNPTKTVTKVTRTADYTPKVFTATPYDADEAAKRIENSGWLKDMRDQATAIDNEYKAKAEKASKQAKMQAWGNMFSALGQLAGLGKNTYVAPDATYLKSALTKADKAREVYDAIKTSNKKSLDAAKQAWLDADRKMHTESQENMRKFYESLNEQGYKNAANNKVETTVEDDDLARFNSETNRIKANASKTSAQAAKDRAKSYSDYVSSGGGKSEDKDWFTPEFGGTVYKTDKKTAGKFADLIEEIAGEQNDFDFDEDTIMSNLSEKVKFDRFARKFINKYGDDPRVKEFIEKLEKK